MNTDFLYEAFEKVPKKLQAWHVNNNITEIPTCEFPDCDNLVHYKRDKIVDYPYNRFCSDKCRKEHRKFTYNDEAKRAAKLYKEGWPLDRIVKIAEISPSVAKRGIKQAGLKIENRRLANKNLLDADWLESKYVTDQMTLEEIANITGTYKGTVYRWLEFHGIDSRKSLDPSIKKLLLDKTWMENKFNAKSLNSVAEELGVSEPCVRRYAKKHNISPSMHISAAQNELFEYIKSLSPNDVKQEVKIDGISFDVVCGKLAFEYDGIYWHSENISGRNKSYHLRKTNHAMKHGYKLFHIFENEWELNPVKKDIWKSIIRINLSKTVEKYGAREFSFEKISYTDKNKFLEENHIQGRDFNSSLYYGLIKNDEIYSVMTFGKPRFGNIAEWELHRFATKKNIHISGAASKLLHHFTDIHKPKSILSYADRRISQGDLYHQLGFKQYGVSEPSYYYTKNHKELFHRTKFQRKNLPKLLEHFDPALSEWENMKMNGYDRIWDCGQLVFLWTL